MDPYVTIETRMQKVRTKTLQGAGKTPKWNQSFTIDVKYIGDDISFIVLDEDVTSSDEVGRMTTKLSSFCVPGGLDDWFQITFKGKKSGMVHLKGNFKPHSVAGKAQHATTGALNNVMGSILPGAQPMMAPMYPQPAYGMPPPQYGMAQPIPMGGFPPQQPPAYGMPPPQ